MNDFLNFNPTLPERKSFVGTLQTAWDSTSLSSLMSCPRHYYYSIVCGVIPQGESVHLRFGIHYHSALELYNRQRAIGKSRNDAIAETLKYVLAVTWEPRLNRPWISGHETKNRYTLVRTVLDYLDHYNDDTEFLKTVLLPDGKPAVELSFNFKLDYETPLGTPYTVCGHIDRLVELGGFYYPTDYKTTTMPLNEKYWQQYTPNNQITLYYFAGQIIFKERITGLIIDGVSIGKDGSEFERKTLQRTEAQLQEWHRDLGFYLRMAEVYSQQNYWPMNSKACMSGYKACEYIGICSNCPTTRQSWVQSGYGIRNWDPLVVRGEV